MSGDRRPTNPKPFHTDAEELISDRKKAEHLNKHIASDSKLEGKCNLDRGIKKNLKEEERSMKNRFPALVSFKTTSHYQNF